jgi:hypothetical protein
VRTLCHHLAAGRHQGAVRLWRTAEFSAAPAPEGLLEHYEVSPAVNRVVNDSAELIAPASAVAASPAPESAPAKPKQPDDQLSLF